MQDLRAQGRPGQEGVRVRCYVRLYSFLWRYGRLEEDLFRRLSAAKDFEKDVGVDKASRTRELVLQKHMLTTHCLT